MTHKLTKLFRKEKAITALQEWIGYWEKAGVVIKPVGLVDVLEFTTSEKKESFAKTVLLDYLHEQDVSTKDVLGDLFIAGHEGIVFRDNPEKKAIPGLYVDPTRTVELLRKRNILREEEGEREVVKYLLHLKKIGVDVTDTPLLSLVHYDQLPILKLPESVLRIQAAIERDITRCLPEYRGIHSEDLPRLRLSGQWYEGRSLISLAEKLKVEYTDSVCDDCLLIKSKECKK